MATAISSDLVAGATAVARQHRRALSAPHTQQAAARGELLTITGVALCWPGLKVRATRAR